MLQKPGLLPGEGVGRSERVVTELETNRALTCLAFLPQALLKMPTRGGAERVGGRYIDLRNSLVKVFHGEGMS